ncbi:DNA mismatch repair protein MutS [Halapricum hydrolyticum]|uniref:DNA mismatch repair protein MutS n=1 Tax=Halapricum hydrolyticum TaxID=2979991 RepID=A0AAE3IAE7_9EURY|nr:DNA mismatch repair protein MutS [Halapricum hydrolyticum]MCU4717127.1 DNA mismatch repair protein MutS [Halapricum hydrolyticum]MCU4726054.1 DNA mismatch repair protein MutS [Halapricum hydrolyticum]
MDAALGAPEKMAGRADELTPMMAQYFELTRQYDDALVLFQVGDFYEAFCEAAERVARLCEITLTKREDSTGEYAMAGIPIDNAESYVETLLDAGYRVAIADQVEDPDEVSGVVERAVTRIITPGTLTEDELLGGAANNYVAALACEGSRYGLAILDVSTGDAYATGSDSLATVADELGRFDPSEAIVGPDAPTDPFDCMVTPYDERAFTAEQARERVGEYFGPPERLLASDAEVRACGALLAYAEYTRGGAGVGEDGRLEYLNHLTRYDPREYMVLDAVALESLEVFDRRSVRSSEGLALIDAVDETACAMGRRELTDWLRRPLIERDRIEARHEAVEELVGAVRTRERLHDRLREVYDLERLISRVSRGRANARDLNSLGSTLDVVPEIRDAIADSDSTKLQSVHDHLDDLPEIRSLIAEAIADDPPPELTEGGVIAPGYDGTLDELRETERSGKAWVEDLEEQERERTGIDSLKVGHNAVHGYYIEVTDANLDRVPEDYQRRQTLKNSERYYTPELKEREDEIISAEQRADDREYELFVEVRETVAAESERVQELADALAQLDVLVSFATVAAEFDYTRPEIAAEGIEIEAGRHPVVERTEDAFVPNGAALDREHRVMIVTGPNMSGKSTYMRQIALTALLAQAGSFVPAERARLRIVDRVFTRVGASDDIAGGRSTFMIEMTELAEILEHATADSLVLLDEVGRGTSTTDGLAIARAVTEFVHDEVGATTLFATHHHELTDVADELPGVFNRHFRTSREDGEVVFEHEIAPGAAEASYGVEVAGVAGVPETVVQRAADVLAGETTASADDGVPTRTNGSGSAPGSDRESKSASNETLDSAGETDAIRDRLREVSIAETTPLEALQLLAELQSEIEE